ncbi:hypothetical protein GCM10029976_016760 [Kribbella albertanoniae]|uniref:HNH endonuclease n=1 Tax=Kribbella albertanoniae TaxID=1266829 RepID=A0A4R4Q6Y2_9ACTN|nr:HNH endonuclease signature motif containing protein [Kribbella albertanoniae]TDC30880.1 HNH endonuclease [Kribbella albertanoniae]
MSAKLLTRLDTIQAAKALLKADELQTMGRLEEMGAAQEMGARDTVELVSERYRLDRADVRKDLAFTAALRKYPVVAAAMADPADPTRSAVVRSDLAEIVVGTLEKAPSSTPVETLAVAEEQLVKMARISNPRELAKFGQTVLSRLDTDGPEPAEDEAASKEFLRLRQTAGGVKFTGFFAGASGEQLKTQIHQGSKPHKTIDGERDPRTQDQRQADALKATMDAAAGNPDHPGVPHITVTIDFNDLKAALAAAPAAFGGSTASGPGAVGELVFGDNLSAGAVRLLACDAAVLPIVLGGDSQPLDVGTEQRFVNRYIRRALNKRDKGCVVCQAPPWMCHAHHLVHWASGGPTSLQNLALLCAAHHRAVHDGQWAVSITAAGVHVTRPSWADPPPVPDRAALAALIGWVTPAPSSGASASTTGAGASAGASGGVDLGDSSAGRDDADSAAANCWGESTADISNSAGASTPRASSNPTHEHPGRLPAARILPDPVRAAEREAFRAQLLAHAPRDFDPWGTNTTPTTGPP